MHPAKSVIYFTVATGAGYGLMGWLAVFGVLGLVPADHAFGIAAFGLAFFLIVSGLLSSTGHLGRPERAWRALSQWRSSWLSREGVLAILSFGPTGLYALAWVLLGQNSGLVGIIGLVGAGLCMMTVFATSMIYASLKTIPGWSNRWVSIGYLVMSLMSGSVLMLVLQSTFTVGASGLIIKIAIFFLALGGIIKLLYWHSLSTLPARSTATTATGLGGLGANGQVRMVESPHSEDNFLLKEMGYKIARKHAHALKRLALVLGFIIPMALVATLAVLAPEYSLPVSLLAMVFVALGLATERWLFFAEAKHVVTLYYGETEI